MTLTSIHFFVFIIIALILYFNFPPRYKWIILLFSSLYFYIYTCGKYVIYIIVTGITTWLAAYFLSKSNSEKRQNIIVAFTILLNFGILALVKYYGFCVENIEKLFLILGWEVHIPKYSFVLPLGISFYTFASIGYLLDVKHKLYECERNFAKYFTYIIYFPHIIQGPIGRINRLKEQIEKNNCFDYVRTIKGLQLMTWGYFKKIVIADQLGIIVDLVFGDYTQYTGLLCIISVVFYSIQIYADFSGCMNILGGISEIFGITLDKNFETPYFSTSIPEFWRRWHISLGAWFRDYLFYSVLRSKWVEHIMKSLHKKFDKKRIRNLPTYISLAIVWFTTGVWHGASWHFIIWGVYYGILIISSTMWKKQIKNITNRLKIKVSCDSFKLFQILRTYILVCFGYILFRADNMKIAFGMIKQIFSTNYISCFLDGNIFSGLSITGGQWLIMCISILLLFLVDLYNRKDNFAIWLSQQNLMFRWGFYWSIVILIFIGFVMQNGGYGNTVQFIYMQF